MTDWKERCIELEGLLSKLHEYVHSDARFLLDEDSGAGIYGVELDISIDESLTRTRAELAQPEPEETTRREALIHFESFAATFEASGGDSDLILRALARFGRPAIKPVLVSERLPGPEECDAEGRCWWSAPETNTKCAVWCFGPKYPPSMFGAISWLPHHALPIPQ